MYIKTRGPDGPDVRFSAPGVGAGMGDRVTLPNGRRRVDFQVVLTDALVQRVEVIRRGEARTDVLPLPVATNSETLAFSLEVGAGDWVRLNVRDGVGPTLMTNPIYFE